MRDPIFHKATPEVLSQLATYLGYDPSISSDPPQQLSDLNDQNKKEWLDAHRDELEDALCRAAACKTYAEVVRAVASRLGVSQVGSTAEIEAAIVPKVWDNTLQKMSAAEREDLQAKAEELAEKHGTSISREIGGFATLAAAQMSGFGVYLLGSTVLGAINGALGLGLGFGAFAGLSKVISVMIGPIGWAALGLYTLAKLGGPDFKRILPAVILLAASRAGDAAEGAKLLAPPHGVPPQSSPRAIKASIREVPKAPRLNQGSMLAEELTRALRSDIIQLERKQTPTKPTSSAGRGPSSVKVTRQDRDIFKLKNSGLCSFLATLDPETHFLDLPPDSQDYVRQCFRVQEDERHATELKAKRDAEIARKTGPSKRQTVQSRTAKQREKKRSEYSRLLPNVQFSDPALDRLLELDDVHQMPMLTQIQRMNAGVMHCKHEIPLTTSPVLQRDAGKEGRIYFRRTGHSRAEVLLVGTKHTQEADYSFLRARY